MTVIENDSPKAHYKGPFNKGQLLPLTFPYTDKTHVFMLIDGMPAIYNVDYEIITEVSEEHPVAYPNSVYIKRDMADVSAIVIFRETPLDQQADFPQNSKFRSERIEQALDKICMEQQEQEEKLSRCIVAPITLETFNGQLPEPTPDTVLKWNKEGKELENYDIIGAENAFKEEVRESFATLENEIDNTIQTFETEVNQKIQDIHQDVQDFEANINEVLDEVLSAADQLEHLDNSVALAKNFAESAAVSATAAAESSSEAKYYAELAETTTLDAVEKVTSEKEVSLDEINTLTEQSVSGINTLTEQSVSEINSTTDAILDEIKINGADIINRVSLSMFDTILKDHVLTYEETRGLALQGTYVYKTAIVGERYGYPDFYNKCLEEYNEATTTETVNDATVNVHSNGHKFYNIADKEAIDTFFNTMGSAWFYGIDTENERIFLPRNNYFDQMTGDVTQVGEIVEAGLPTLTTNSTGAHTHTRGTMNITGVLYSVRGSDGTSSSEGALYNTAGANNGANSSANASCKDIRFDASRNWTGATSSNGAHTHTITGTADTVQPPAIKKLLYICVGNTLSDISWIDVATQVEGGVKELEDKTQECIGEIKDCVDTGKDELKESIKDLKVIATLEIGDIGIAPLGIDESRGKRRYLNGQVIIQEQYVEFTKKVKSAVALYPSLACTEAEWQTISTMTVNGQVGKFVVDDEAGTIRLPRIIMPIQGLTDLSKLGEIVEAGLPTLTTNSTGAHTHTRGTMNITGSIGRFNKAFVTSSGAFTTYENGDASGNTYSGGGSIANFDASRNWTGSTSSNGAHTHTITGTADTVQQEQIQYPYFIQVATGAETEANIINEIELNNPYSLLDVKWSDKLLNNISWLRSQGQANSKTVYNDVYNLILREYNSGTEETETVGGVSITFRRGSETNIKVTTNKSAYDSILSVTGTAWYYVLDTTNETFYLPQSDGFLQFGGNGDFVEAGLPNITGNFGQGNYWYLTDNANGAFEVNTGGNQHLPTNSGNASSARGVSFNASRCSDVYGKSNTVQPNAVKGYLYFYVGETVQNANLVNVGRIEEVVSQVKAGVNQVKADVNEVKADVNEVKADKLDKSAVKAYIVETYVNGASWYNRYSNGWIEQGGRFVVNSANVSGGTYSNKSLTFIKPFSQLKSWHCQARHDRFNAGFNIDVGGASSSVDVYQVNDSTASFSNPFVLWCASGYVA